MFVATDGIDLYCGSLGFFLMEGELGEGERGGGASQTLDLSITQTIEKKMKHLERTPGSLRPPDPASILHNLPCFSGLDGEVVDTILTYAEFVQLEQTESLLEEGAESKGIYVIVSGLVKV